MWKPHPGFQTEFLRRDEFEAFAGGAVGPGKTDLLIVGALEHIDHPKYHGLLLRRTMPRLQEIIDRCMEMYRQFGGIWKAGLKRFEFPSGSRITLGSCEHENDKHDWHGKEFQYMAFDELTEFTQGQYEFIALLRSRSTIPGLKAKVRSASNPGCIGHAWVKERFIDVCKPGRRYVDPKTGMSRIFIPGTVDDNPSLFENDPEYLQRLALQGDLHYQRYRYGIWTAFEGQVFLELNKSVHGCEDFVIDPEWPRYCVFDWGFAKPFAVLWFAMDYDGNMYLYREWYGSKREHEPDSDRWNQGLKLQAWEVARGILERERDAGEKIKRRIADPSIWGKHPEFRKKEARGPTINDDFIQEGVYFTKADNDRVPGRQQVHRRFKLVENIDKETGELLSEDPTFQVFNSCNSFWRTMPLLAEDPKNPDDINSDMEDHIYDCVRYMCMARPLTPKKVNKIPPGSFQAERARYIKAKKFAKRHNCTMDQAYGSVR